MLRVEYYSNVGIFQGEAWKKAAWLQSAQPAEITL